MAEYWHIGETTMRLASPSPRRANGSNSLAMLRTSVGGDGRAQACGLAQFRGLVGRFPGEFGLVASEMTVGSGLAVDRPQQVEHPDDSFRPQVEMRLHELGDALVGNATGALGIDGHVDRLRDADRVRDLDLALARDARRDDVLRDVARRVGRRTIDLRRVLARERAAAMRRRPAVG